MAIKIAGLKYGYGKHQVLKGINLEIKKGQFTAILGANGSGKTTLFRCILGLLIPQSGKITMMGHATANLSVEDIARLVAYVPQEQAVTFNQLVIDFVEMGAGPRPTKHDTTKALMYLKQLGIEKLALKGYLDLSGGQRQLVRLAQGLMQETPILLLDEPTNNLDYGNQLKLLAQCKKLVQEGLTILMTSHNPQDVFNFCDRAVLLQSGKVEATGTVSEVLTQDSLANLYDIDVTLLDDLPNQPTVILPNIKEL